MADKVKNSRFPMKLFSVIMAIVLWLILTYTVNPTITQTVKNIPISFSGADTLASKGLVLINTSEIEKVDVKIRGARSSVIKALSTIRASVDVSDISTKGKSNRYASFDMGVTGVYAEGRNNALITVEVDELVEKNVPVRIVQNGADKNKSIIVESIPEFENLTIRGAKSELERAKEIVIELDVLEISEDAEGDYTYYFLNTDDTKQVFESLQNLPKKIHVTNKAYNRKTVPIKVELEKDSDKFRFEIIDIPLKETDIGIPDNFNDEVNELVYRFNPNDHEEGRKDYTLSPSVNKEIFVRDDAREINVKLELIPLKKTDVRVNVEARSLKSGLRAEISPNNVVIGVRERADGDAKNNLKAYVDLSGLDEGSYEREVKIDSADGVEIDEVAHVNVTITKG